MTEFWLISAPGEKTCQQTWDNMMVATTRTASLSANHKFNIPDLKVGTLDVLVGLSDELAKLDGFVEGVVKKVAQYMADQVSQIDNDLKARASAYNNLKGNLQNLERKNAGSLLTRSLADIVKKEDFVLDSEYLITMLVVVPNLLYEDQDSGLFSVTLFRKAMDDFRHKARENKDFQYNEEELKADKEEMTRLSTDKKKQYGLPVNFQAMLLQPTKKTMKKLREDQDSGLFSVTLFRKAMDDFRHKARENKFTMRDFQYNEEELKADKEEMTRLSTDKKKQFGPLVRWLKVNFSEAFIAWVHIKALRVFVESVLRYGLPVNFQAMLLQPTKKTMKKLREVLNDLYKHLDSSAAGIIDTVMDIPGLNLSQQEYYPYVYYKIDCNVLDFKL
ncbi:hypothetical protein CRUP_029566 [Coryphaenoides rupestris]|nr:hypothetical protein CRUP_029566 [Coryphaenoides rupestris]